MIIMIIILIIDININIIVFIAIIYMHWVAVPTVAFRPVVNIMVFIIVSIFIMLILHELILKEDKPLPPCPRGAVPTRNSAPAAWGISLITERRLNDTVLKRSL